MNKEQLNNITDTMTFVFQNKQLYKNAELIYRWLATKKMQFRNKSRTNIEYGGLI